MLKEKTLQEFLNILAAKEPVPGGGGAAAVTGALAAALTSMVCNFTSGKKGYENKQEAINDLLKKAENLRQVLTELVEKDAQAFTNFMAVYKMPERTQEEKTARQEAMQKRAKEAALVPLQIARLSLEVEKFSLLALTEGNQDLKSDAILACILAHAALKSAYYNVAINLKLLHDQLYKEDVKKELSQLLAQGQKLEEKMLTLSGEFSLDKI